MNGYVSFTFRELDLINGGQQEPELPLNPMPKMIDVAIQQKNKADVEIRISSMCTLQDLRMKAGCEDGKELWNASNDAVLDDEDTYGRYVEDWLKDGGKASLLVAPIGEEPD